MANHIHRVPVEGPYDPWVSRCGSVDRPVLHAVAAPRRARVLVSGAPTTFTAEFWAMNWKFGLRGTEPTRCVNCLSCSVGRLRDSR